MATPAYGNWYPTLRTIASARRLSNEDSRKGLTRLSALEIDMLKLLTINTTQADNLFAMVQHCSIVLSGAAPEEDELSVSTDDLPGYARYAKIVHRVLYTYAACSCRIAPEPEHHLAKLRLKPAYRFSRKDSASFELIFSTSPNPKQSGKYEWQGVQIVVSTSASSTRPAHYLMPYSKDKAFRSVRFCQPGPVIDALKRDAELGPEPIRLCRFISSACGSTLCFKTDGKHLMALDDAEHAPGERHVAAHPGLPLGEVLRDFEMRYGTRPVLAYILAKAVWQYYDSDWMNVGWANNNIYFMNEANVAEEPKYYLRPYLCARLNVSGSKPPEYRPDIGMLHRYPRILSLGMMLTQIAAGRPIDTTGDPNDWDAKTTNERLGTLKSILNGAGFEGDCQYPRYRMVVEKCLSSVLFKNAPFCPQNPLENLEERRLIIYDEIVDPLRRLVEGTGWHVKFDEMERTPFIPKQPGSPSIPQYSVTDVNEIAKPLSGLAPSKRYDCTVFYSLLSFSWPISPFRAAFKLRILCATPANTIDLDEDVMHGSKRSQ